MSRQPYVFKPLSALPCLWLLLSGACASESEREVLATSAALTQPSTDDDSTSLSELSWGSCADEGLDKLGARCTKLSVPLDHNQPHGKKIKIALSKVAHTVPENEYQGIMLINPGGPGSSGLFMVSIGEALPNQIGRAYDLIGFDPRGVGASEPSVHCSEEYFEGPWPSFIPVTHELEQTWLDKSEAYAQACGENSGELLEHVRTTDSAHDMEAIRIALGEQQLNYFGLSYGTYLGQVYATLYPKRVRRMVLDSNVDPTRIFYQSNLDQDIAFQGNVEAWWGWIAQHDDVYHLGSTQREVERAWYAAKHKLSEEPAGGVVGADEWTDLTLSTGYSQGSWARLAGIWSQWAQSGDAQPVADEHGPANDNSFAMYLATQCTDNFWPQRWSQWRADNWRVFKQAPFLTWDNAWYNAPCLFWPAAATQAFEVDGTQVAPILLLGETLDGPTPFGGSLEVRRRFPNAVLVATIGGRTHGNSLSKNPCVSDALGAYLATGTLPARQERDEQDVSCAALPPPQPVTETAYSLRDSALETLHRTLLRAVMHR